MIEHDNFHGIDIIHTLSNVKQFAAENASFKKLGLPQNDKTWFVEYFWVNKIVADHLLIICFLDIVFETM